MTQWKFQGVTVFDKNKFRTGLLAYIQFDKLKEDKIILMLNGNKEIQAGKLTIKKRTV